MQIRFSREIYTKTALLKAAYAFTDRAYIHLDADASDFIASIECKPEQKEISEKEFINEMLHQALRYDVYTKTKTLRELLMARALASTVIENPLHDVAEPDDVPVDIDAILTDWFEHDE